MTPILKKLVGQAGFSTELSEAMAARHNTTSGLEKFAELIVRECCDQVREIDAMEIRKHFGITPNHHAASEWPREL